MEWKLSFLSIKIPKQLLPYAFLLLFFHFLFSFHFLHLFYWKTHILPAPNKQTNVRNGKYIYMQLHSTKPAYKWNSVTILSRDLLVWSHCGTKSAFVLLRECWEELGQVFIWRSMHSIHSTINCLNAFNILIYGGDNMLALRVSPLKGMLNIFEINNS